MSKIYNILTLPPELPWHPCTRTSNLGREHLLANKTGLPVPGGTANTCNLRIGF
jgi:hypothetical protein